MDKKRQKQRELSSSVKKHWVRLTRLCNNRCIFCLDKEPQNGTVIPFIQIKNRFSEGLKSGATQVILSGGEATLHPKFLEIVRLAKKMGYQRVQVITNGRMFSYENFLEEAVRVGVDEMTFSIHGHTAKLHDAQTGIKGSFDQVLRGLKNALAVPGLIVNQDIVINKMNVGQLKEIMDFFIDLGVREFDLLQIIPFGRAWDNRKKLFYDIEEELSNLQRVFKLAGRKDIFVWTNRFPAKYLEGYEELIQNPKKILDEVKGGQKMFEDFWKKGKKPYCHPQRCSYCFLEKFCTDLLQFRQAGFIRSENMPPCLSGTRARRQLKWLEADIEKFSDFFISERYFVKGRACQKCRLRDCRGADINFIRHNGFKKLKPIQNG